MRKLASAIALLAVLGTAALPALCCQAVEAHACCARKGDDSAASAVGRAPCCEVTGQVAPAAREATGARPLQPPQADARVPLRTGALAAGGRPARQPACLRSPAPPPIGPPLRLRV